MMKSKWQLGLENYLDLNFLKARSEGMAGVYVNVVTALEPA